MTAEHNILRVTGRWVLVLTYNPVIREGRPRKSWRVQVLDLANSPARLVTPKGFAGDGSYDAAVNIGLAWLRRETGRDDLSVQNDEAVT